MSNLEMNRLPVPTWNQCGVNYAPKAAVLPVVSAEGWNGANVTASVPESIVQGAAGFAAFAESGMGVGTDEFVLTNANAKFSLSAAQNTAIDAPAVFEVAIDAQHPAAITCVNVDAAAGSSLTVVQIFRGNAQNGVNASLVRIRAAENANVKLVQVQLLGENVRSWNAVAIEEAKGAKVEHVRVELGASLSACGARAALAANHSEYDLDAVYFGEDDNVLDYNDVSVHTGRDTLCEMHTAGVLTGHADKILRGTIDFRRGAKRGVGHESEDVLLFSPNVRNRTAPLILCGEEEVEGQHAASIGRLDEGKLYYLRARGLSEEQARRLMVDARFAPAIEKIPLEAVQNEVREAVARRLDHADKSVG